jgi:PAS domain S-box-containing protein
MKEELQRLNKQLNEEITERKKMEEALLEREAQYRALFEGSPDTILLADPETGIILDANPAASRLLARPYEEIIGLHYSSIHPAQKETYSRKAFTQHVEESRKRTEPLPIKNTICRPDGSEVPVEVWHSWLQSKRKKFCRESSGTSPNASGRNRRCMQKFTLIM